MKDIILPDQPWWRNAGFQAVVAALSVNGEPPRIVGGAVRDGLLGLDVSDVDLATKLHPEQIMQALQAAGIRAIPTGIEHGTITAHLDGKNYEITTLRRDLSTDGRRATVAFSADWADDAARRDFTINALYADPQTGKIFDYFDGLKDLSHQHIRFIGQAMDRINEDYLRILRYFRFLARFGNDRADDDAVAACATGAKGLMGLSRERIASELLKILGVENPNFAISLMIKNGIFTNFLPEIADDAGSVLMRLTKNEARFNRPISINARLISILKKNAETIDKAVMRLKFSNQMRRDLSSRMKHQYVNAANICAVAYRCGMDCAYDAALLFAADDEIGKSVDRLNGWDIPKFPIKGGDLIGMGLLAGPVVAQTLQEIENIWVDEGFPPPPRLAEITNQAVTAALLSTKKA